MYTVNEQDWQLFRKHLPVWQEAYIERLIAEYTELLTSPKQASEKFHILDQKIHNDRKRVGVQARMSRSCMVENILGLLYDGVITADNLDDFSDDLRSRLLFIIRECD